MVQHSLESIGKVAWRVLVEEGASARRVELLHAHARLVLFKLEMDTTQPQPAVARCAEDKFSADNGWFMASKRSNARAEPCAGSTQACAALLRELRYGHGEALARQLARVIFGLG